MPPALADDPVRVSVRVNAGVTATFRAFVEDTDAWWKRGEPFRIAGSHEGTLHLEPFMHGRLFESFDKNGVTRVVRVGRVIAWEPPKRIVLEWRAPQCGAQELTEVEVMFESEGTETRVQLTHQGWSKLPVEHPARHALDPMTEFWTTLLRSFRGCP